MEPSARQQDAAHHDEGQIDQHDQDHRPDLESMICAGVTGITSRCSMVPKLALLDQRRRSG